MLQRRVPARVAETIVRRLLGIGGALLLLCSGSTPAQTGGCEMLVVVGLKDEAEVAEGPGVRVVISAADAALLRERLARVDATRLRGVVSFGIAGALDPELRVGDLRVASEVLSGEQRWPTDPGMRSELRSRLGAAAGPVFREAVFLGSDELEGIDAEANRSLRRDSGADLVDMESHLAAAFAEREGLPFGAIRAISDTAQQEIPPAALLPLRPDGSGDWKGVLRSVIAQPSQLRDLWAMVKGFGAAMDTLRALRKRLSLADLLPRSQGCGSP